MIYAYLCEDVAIELFIEKALEKLGPKTKCKVFSIQPEFRKKYGATAGRNSSQIRKLFNDASKSAIGEFKVDLFIVAYDYDDGDKGQYETVIREHKKILDNKIKNKSVFCIPIQNIEYWLWYLMRCNDEVPPLPNSLENDVTFNRHKAKAEVYGKPLKDNKYTGQPVETELAKANTILESADFDKLYKLSTSFKSFVDQLKVFCSTYK